jgi:hypothetical protein
MFRRRSGTTWNPKTRRGIETAATADASVSRADRKTGKKVLTAYPALIIPSPDRGGCMEGRLL